MSTSIAPARRRWGSLKSNVANSMLYALAGSGQASPNYWLNPQNGVNYQVVVQTPQYKIDSRRRVEEHSRHRQARRRSGAGGLNPQCRNC